MLLLLLTACIENNLGLGKQDPGDFDSGTPILDTGGDSDTVTTPPPEEVCDGIDNDGDGAVDEDFSDIDVDGTADCVDDACTVDVPAARAEVDPACQEPGLATVPPVDPWNQVIEWQNLSGAVLSTPVVGDLALDGVPDVVVGMSSSGTSYGGDIVVLDGATGAQTLAIPGADVTGGVALGDVDGDGFGDIVGIFGPSPCVDPSEVRAYDRTGVLLWSSPPIYACESYPAIADLDGDGTVEVVSSGYVLDGGTGAVETTLPVSSSDWSQPALADMDGDGIQEILYSNQVIDISGVTRYACGSNVGAIPHPVNADADSEGEMLVSAYGLLTLCDDDGTVLWSRAHGVLGTALAIADFDGDGAQEIAFPNGGLLFLLEMDGTEIWRTPISDSSGLAGATSWDIDLDGVPEVVYADEVDILVIDGATGTVVIREGAHGSMTLAETPAVADVDGDGQGELIYGSDLGLTGITVVGGADGDWPWAPPVYNQHSYYAANIGEDLSVPATPEAPWIQEGNLFRGQPSALVYKGDVELAIDITDTCAASCEDDGVAMVEVQVWNAGVTTAPAGLAVDLWADFAGVETLVGTQLTATELAPQTSLELSFTVTGAALRERLVARVDAADTVSDCDVTDNEDVRTDLPCR
jgi:hypothetical protein